MFASRFCSILGTGLVLVFCAAASADAFDIDTFNEGDLNILVTGSDTVWYDDYMTNLPSDYRHVVVDTYNAAGIGYASAVVFDGSLSLGTMSVYDYYEAIFSLDYDFYGGLDLINTGTTSNTGILFEFDSADHDFDLSVYVESGDGSDGKYTIDCSACGSSQIFMEFEDFRQMTTTAIDWNDIVEMKITLCGEPDGDYHIDNISATTHTPEPFTLSLLGVGGAGLLLRRKRK